MRSKQSRYEARGTAAATRKKGEGLVRESAGHLAAEAARVQPVRKRLRVLAVRCEGQRRQRAAKVTSPPRPLGAPCQACRAKPHERGMLATFARGTSAHRAVRTARSPHCRQLLPRAQVSSSPAVRPSGLTSVLPSVGFSPFLATAKNTST
jgi:hypothetical protein